jgi:hypothetical protein
VTKAGISDFQSENYSSALHFVISIVSVAGTPAFSIIAEQAPEPVSLCCTGFRLRHKQKTPSQAVKGFFCGNSWNRTNDTSIFSAVLYQLSYVAVSPQRL